MRRSGARLGAYRFDRYRTRETAEDKPRLASLTVLLGDFGTVEAARAAWPALEAVAQGVALTRDLVSEPANVLSPPVFAERIEALASLGLEIETLGPAEMERLGFGALLGVAMGSDKEPRTVIMRWNGGAAGTAPVAFIGKGVTFDSGGISIKPAGGMEDMKWDMAGAGTVVGLMAALAGRRARVNAIGVVGPCREHAGGERAAAGRRGEEPFRPDHRGAQHRCRGAAGAGRRAFLHDRAVQSALHGRPRDADRGDHRRPRPRACPGCSATPTAWRSS